MNRDAGDSFLPPVSPTQFRRPAHPHVLQGRKLFLEGPMTPSWKVQTCCRLGERVLEGVRRTRAPGQGRAAVCLCARVVVGVLLRVLEGHGHGPSSLRAGRAAVLWGPRGRRPSLSRCGSTFCMQLGGFWEASGLHQGRLSTRPQQHAQPPARPAQTGHARRTRRQPVTSDLGCCPTGETPGELPAPSVCHGACGHSSWPLAGASLRTPPVTLPQTSSGQVSSRHGVADR